MKWILILTQFLLWKSEIFANPLPVYPAEVVARDLISSLDFFKEYAKEVGAGAVLGDSFMIILACLLASHFATYSLNINIITLIISLYFFPYMINYE